MYTYASSPLRAKPSARRLGAAGAQPRELPILPILPRWPLHLLPDPLLLERFLRYHELSHNVSSVEPCATSASLRHLLSQLVTHCCRLSPWTFAYLPTSYLAEAGQTAENDERPAPRGPC